MDLKTAFNKLQAIQFEHLEDRIMEITVNHIKDGSEVNKTFITTILHFKKPRAKKSDCEIFHFNGNEKLNDETFKQFERLLNRKSYKWIY